MDQVCCLLRHAKARIAPIKNSFLIDGANETFGKALLAQKEAKHDTPLAKMNEYKYIQSNTVGIIAAYPHCKQ